MSTAPPADFHATLNWAEAIDRLLQETPASAERAVRLAGLLREWVPGAEGYACHLLNGTKAHLTAVDRNGDPRPEWANGLRTELAHLASTRVGDVPGPSGSSALAASVAFRDRFWGHLILGASDDHAAAQAALLVAASDQLAVQLLLEEEQRRVRALREELIEAEALTTVGVASDGLLHEIGNYLNRMMLQASIVQMRLPEERRSELAVIREEGTGATALLRPMQQRRQQRRQAKSAVDLNRLLRETIAEEPGAAERVRFKPGSDLPVVEGRRADVKRLLRLVLRGFLGYVEPGEPVEVRTEKADTGHPRVVLADGGPTLPQGAEGKPLDSEDGLFGAADPVDRLALEVLVRETAASLQTRNLPEGGVELGVEWS